MLGIRNSSHIFLDEESAPKITIVLPVALRQNKVVSREHSSFLNYGRDDFFPLTFFHPLFLLHPPILEPYLDLSFVKAEGRGYFYPSSPCQVLIEVKLLFQFCKLFGVEGGAAGVVDAAGPSTAAAARRQFYSLCT